MRKVAYLSAFLVIACTAGASAQKALPSAAISACNSPERKAAIQQAKLVLTIDRASYSLSDQMVVDVGIRNDGRQPIYVYSETWWGLAGGFALEFWDAAKKFIGPGFQDEEVMPPPRDQDLNDRALFVPLGQDNFFGVRRVLSVKAFLKSPGKYTLTIQYGNPLSCFVFGPRVQALSAIWLEDPSMVSNRVSFEVTP
jgi:hypothetical protein